MKIPAALFASLCALASTLGCGEDPASSDAERTASSASSASSEVPPASTTRAPHERQAYFGDLHVHSSWSMDAFSSGVRVGPEHAYRYALGEAIPHVSGKPIQLAGPPLDFMALADHAEYLGVIQATQKPVHPLHDVGLFQIWVGKDVAAARSAWKTIMRSFGQRIGLPELVSNEVIRPAWKELVDLADRYDEPGIFTAFVAYEYTSNPDFQNLHRNVIFRGSKVPDRPFSAMDSPNPEDLWRWMDRARREGDDLIAIPHNANGSNGKMFARTRFDGSPIDADWIDERIRNEPLAEVMQIKGQSETRPVLSPNDEWANFEVAPWRTVNPAYASKPHGSYVREALTAGLEIRDRFGRNPYALGVVGSTDGHNAASPFEEANYTGKIGRSDGTPRDRLAVALNPSANAFSSVAIYWSAAGLAGIWSDANTRGDLFDAMRRRETYSTSGPRLRVRFFGGWGFEPEDAGPELARKGYAEGVPMGGDLPRNGAAPSPTFLLAASKDPIEARLERIQIIKGWIEAGAARERVYDVACADGTKPDAESSRCPNRASNPSLETCEPDATFGANEFDAWWRDPDFDPSERAFYYVRVLQVPTCRWSTWDAIRLGVPIPRMVPAAIQERAITSAIWYEPS